MGKRWSAALEPLDTGAEYEKDPAATTDKRYRCRQALLHYYAKADVLSEGAVEGDTEGKE